jgi:ATP-dependent DNA ligase
LRDPRARPELVIEVRYDHFSGGRLRHGTRFLRWRPDKAPRQCAFGQLPAPRGGALDLLEGVSRAKPAASRERRGG